MLLTRRAYHYIAEAGEVYSFQAVYWHCMMHFDSAAEVEEASGRGEPNLAGPNSGHRRCREEVTTDAAREAAEEGWRNSVVD